MTITLSNDLVDFLTNWISQIVLIMAGIFGGIKWIEKRQKDQIRDEVEKMLTPIETNIALELQKIKSSIEKTKEINEIQLAHVEDAIGRLLNNKNHRERERQNTESLDQKDEREGSERKYR